MRSPQRVTIDMVRVRHSHNTWGAFENLLKMWRPAEQAPDFVSPTLLAQLRAAHEATGRRAACPVVEQHAVDGMDKTKAVAKLRRARSRRLLEARASSEREEIFAMNLACAYTLRTT